MKNLERCPRCFNLPEVAVETKDLVTTVVLSCPQHGHIAQGSSLDQARDNWNLYISFVKVQVA